MREIYLPQFEAAIEEGGTSVTYDADLVMKGPAKVADPLVALGFKKMGDEAPWDRD